MFTQNKAVLAVFLTTVASAASAQSTEVIGTLKSNINCIEGSCAVNFQVNRDGSLKLDKAEAERDDSPNEIKILDEAQTKAAGNYVLTQHLSQHDKDLFAAVVKIYREKLPLGDCKDFDLELKFQTYVDGTSKQMRVVLRNKSNSEYLASMDLPTEKEAKESSDFSLEKLQKEFEDGCAKVKADRAAKPSFKTVTGSDKPGH